MIMNRILSLVLSCAMLLTCLGCSQRGQDTATGTTDQNLTTDLQQPAADSTVSADKITSQTETPSAPQPEEPYVRVIDPAKPMVALTYDDGPHPVYSHAILDTLESNHSVATFFEVAINIPRAPDALVRMLELGCEVGSHSNAHLDLGKMDQKTMLQDLDAADEAFIAATGKAPTLLRPPYGSINDAVQLGSGRSVVTWDVDTLDWEHRDAATVVSYIQSLGDLDGRILLMHSIYESTAEATKVLVPWLIEQGYQLVTVSELFAYYYGELLQPNQLYSYTYFSSHSRTDTPATLPDPNEPVPPVEIPVIEVELKPTKPAVPTTPTKPAQPVTPAPAPTPTPAPVEPAPAPVEPAPAPVPPATETPAPQQPAPEDTTPPAVDTPPAEQPPAAETPTVTPPATEVPPVESEPPVQPESSPAPAPTEPAA